MKICHVTNYLPGYHKIWGGAEQACYRVLKLQIKNGQHVVVLATKPVKKPEEEFDFFIMPVLEDYLAGKIKKTGHYLKQWFPFDLVSYILSYKILKKIKPDILHFHNFDVLSFSLILSAKKLGVPTLFSVYDYWCVCPRIMLIDIKGEICKRFHGPHCTSCLEFKKFGNLQKFFSRFRRKFFDFFLNKIDVFIVLSKSSAKILRQYGIKKEKIYIIKLPLLEETASVQKFSEIQKNLILYVGWISQNKGLHILLKAMPQVLKEVPLAQLYVIGDAADVEMEYKSKTVTLIKELRLDRHISLLGKKPYHEVKHFFQKANVVVIPEQWENMSPIVLAEAMAFEKPVVASRIGGIPEFIEDGKNGFLADPKNPLDFAEKIIWMLKKEKSALEMGKNAKKEAIQIFDEDKISKKLLALYKSLARSRFHA